MAVVVVFFFNFVHELDDCGPSKTHFHLCRRPVVVYEAFQFTPLVSHKTMMLRQNVIACNVEKIRLWQIVNGTFTTNARAIMLGFSARRMFVKTGGCNCQKMHISVLLTPL